MQDIASFIMTPATLIGAVVAVMVFFAVLTWGRSVTDGDELSKRMKAVGARREELRRLSRQQVGKETASIRRQDSSPYRAIVEKLNLRTLLEDPKVVDNLAMAGYRGPKPVSTFYFFRMTMPFVLGIIAGFYLFIMHIVTWPLQVRILVTVVAFVAGYYVPNMYISNKASKRRESIISSFPDALDLMLICVEAGMSIESALQKVAGEIGPNSIELAEELSLLVAELSYLPERRMAYEGLTRRINHPGIKAVCTAMIQAEKYGTPLGTALRVMAKENRELRLSAAEKKAAALPAQLTVPMILFFLPVLFLVILGPVIIRFGDIQKHNQSNTVINSKPIEKK